MARFGSARTLTRPLAWPVVALSAYAQALPSALRGEPALVLGLVVAGLLAQGLNMFNYPAATFMDDQGIYASQAWAVLREARLSPYTYIYDHAPGGWILLAAWSWLTGGPHAFGGAIDSGRMLMLLLHLAMVPLLYHLARKLGCPAPVAALAALLFSVSPLAVFYQRLLLLDTIMLFWVLVSLDLLLNGWGRLSRIAASGACFGLAMLSKESAVFLLPAMLFIAVQDRRRHQGRYAVVAWLLPMAMAVSFYPLYAFLKGELFPSATAAIFGNGYAGSNVSLFNALWWQLTRTGGGPFNLDNQFWRLVGTDWMARDALLFAGGAAAVGLNLLRGIRNRRALAAGLLGALPLFYLARGGVVFNYYVLLAIPFLCLNLGVLLAPVFARLPRRLGGALAVMMAAALVGGYWYAGTAQPLYRERPDAPGREAMEWIKAHLPPESMIITRDVLWTDLREPGDGGPAFSNAHSHWKVAGDPAIRTGIFKDDWRTVDYIIMSPGLEQDFRNSNNTIALEALRHAHPIMRWEAGPGDEQLHAKQSLVLWKVDKPGALDADMLKASGRYIAAAFEKDGAYANADGSVTSESQSYAMLRAVWTDERAAFDRAWTWTQGALLDEHGLPAWLWRDGRVEDPHTAADADVDTALALLMGGRRWEDPALIEAGTRMAQAIWRRDVVLVAGAPYLTGGDWGDPTPVLALNPSYFSPHAFHVFKEVDPEHDWLALIDAGYRVLFDVTAAGLGRDASAGLPPDWVGIDGATGALVPLPSIRADTSRYGYDAARTWWRIALDDRWNGDGRARAYLLQAGFLRDEANRQGRVSTVYEHDGSVVEAPPSPVGTAGAVAALLTLAPETAHALYTSQMITGAHFSDAGVYWGQPTDLYAQAWGWFGMALYAGALPDLWHQRN